MTIYEQAHRRAVAVGELVFNMSYEPKPAWLVRLDYVSEGVGVAAGIYLALVAAQNDLLVAGAAAGWCLGTSSVHFLWGIRKGLDKEREAARRWYIEGVNHGAIGANTVHSNAALARRKEDTK